MLIKYQVNISQNKHNFVSCNYWDSKTIQTFISSSKNLRLFSIRCSVITTLRFYILIEWFFPSSCNATHNGPALLRITIEISTSKHGWLSPSITRNVPATLPGEFNASSAQITNIVCARSNIDSPILYIFPNLFNELSKHVFVCIRKIEQIPSICQDFVVLCKVFSN